MKASPLARLQEKGYADADRHGIRPREYNGWRVKTEDSGVQLNDALLARLQSYDRALDAREVAQLLHVRRSTIFRLCEQREIPHFRVGKLVRFYPATLAAWLIEKQAIVDFRKMMQGEDREARRA